MANITAETIPKPHDNATFHWSTVTNTDTPVAVSTPRGGIGSIVASGTFDSATMVLHGSPDGVTYFALKDIGNTAISLTADGGATVMAPVMFVKPVFSGGGGSQDVDVTLFLSQGPERHV